MLEMATNDWETAPAHLAFFAYNSDQVTCSCSNLVATKEQHRARLQQAGQWQRGVNQRLSSGSRNLRLELRGSQRGYQRVEEL